jgi:large subunit ribosomal protein L9
VRRELDLPEASKKIDGVVVEIARRRAKRRFGSVTVVQIAEKLAEKGIDVDRRRIDLAEPIKTLGEHSVVVKLHRQVTATIKVKVVVAS